ncbi:hypothetical protein OSB04_031443 [Centaurea solstitialis]|uniref:Zinc finger, CCHC-type n=1 Tax=Centaurea solstitialis TaxID=347529 RepID=A0AA38S9H5_9ASTR|nr:hypothetical protein OSB04_031443 [Centaurea solstitialis]
MAGNEGGRSVVVINGSSDGGGNDGLLIVNRGGGDGGALVLPIVAGFAVAEPTPCDGPIDDPNRFTKAQYTLDLFGEACVPLTTPRCRGQWELREEIGATRGDRSKIVLVVQPTWGHLRRKVRGRWKCSNHERSRSNPKLEGVKRLCDNRVVPARVHPVPSGEICFGSVKFTGWYRAKKHLEGLKDVRFYPMSRKDLGVMSMANTVTNTNNLSLCSILEKDKLTGSNFLDWERNLQIVLRALGEAPPTNVSAAIRNAYQKRSDDLLDVGCLMLATMSPELQTGLMNTNAYDMIRQLRDMFQTQARTERYDATRALNVCKMAKGTSVSAHVMKMKRLLDHLERLGHPVPLQLATDTILNTLSERSLEEEM